MSQLLLPTSVSQLYLIIDTKKLNRQKEIAALRIKDV